MHLRWKMYRCLFPQEHDERLTVKSPHVFGLYRWVLFDVVLLDIAKLLSWRGSGSHAVVSLHRLIRKSPLPLETKMELEHRFQILRDEKHEPIIAHRDRRIAHNDVAIASNVEQLTVISRAQVDAAIADIVDMLNRVTQPSESRQIGFNDRFPQQTFEAEVVSHLLMTADLDSAQPPSPDPGEL